MSTKKAQALHWLNHTYPNPHKTTLSSFMARAAMRGMSHELHLFTLELLYIKT